MARASRKAPSPLDTPDPRFEGSAYSNGELQFFIDHLGQSFQQAVPLEDDMPENVNEAAVQPLLDRWHSLSLYEQQLQEKHKDPSIRVWCGYEAIKVVCQQTLESRAQVQELKRRTRGRKGPVRLAASSPSLHMWDFHTGQAVLGAVGADPDRVLTRIMPDGTRQELHVEIQQTGMGSIRELAGVADFISKTTTPTKVGNVLLENTPEELTYTEEEGSSYGSVSCPICNKTETYEVLKSESKRKAAGMVLKHLDTEKHVKVDEHRLLSTRLKSGRAGANRNRIPVPVGA